MPDTALHIDKRPFFIPDYAEPCVMHLHRAIHICRLGRNISERFASRYYDGCTLCTRMEAPSLPPSVGLTFDECITVGEWQAPDALDAMEALAPIAPLAAKAIAEVSRYFTLRQGDVILLDEPRNAEPVHIGQHIEEKIGTSTVLQYNIK